MSSRNLAGDGNVWVCGACGRTSADRYRFSDAACFVNAVECRKASIERDERDRVIKAVAA